MPYGSWPSQISAQQLVAQSLRLAEPRLAGDYLFWLETRPEEKGRNCIVRCKPGGAPEDVLQAPLSARSKVNEYGGGSFCVFQNTVFFVLADDQRIYRLDLAAKKPWLPVVITPEADFRFGDLHYDSKRHRLLAVCEDHSLEGQEPKARIVSIDADGRDSFTLVEGSDFYSSPRVSPCGQFFSWLSWEHPAMPWASNSCFAANLNEQGVVCERIAVAGAAANQKAQAIFQPQWSKDSELYLVSDVDDWWRLYKVNNDGDSPPELQPVLSSPPPMAEFGMPHWVFGQQTWGFLDQDTIIASFTRNGFGHLCIANISEGTWQEINTPWTDFGAVCAANGAAAVLAGSYCEPTQLAYWHTNKDHSHGEWCRVTDTESGLDACTLSEPEAISFGPILELAHAFYYPPHNGTHCGPGDERPPLIVLAHGGPTSQTTTALNIKIQYWCSRGFAVVDVNYRGSTGYGRQYRQALDTKWGVSDVEDVCRAAQYLVDRNLADPQRLAIKGGSAGGYTVLAALTFTDTFKAGASLYGIGDLETLVLDTHKFESRYVDSLVGPYPEAKPLYHQRSPLYHVDQLNCPVIFFQGAEDKVVPPNQAQAMVAALDQKTLQVAYVEFAGEGHGFRQAENIVCAIESELYFYSQIFGFEIQDKITPVNIKNF
ncbi:S9 family peptidase [Halioxenophilus aromaticivorans]|uniref:S9 family peptidase n=1 Tax=Halioxenophilus aromaticivorans TaxID=1306992 RepID=A0AAV3U9Y0_9ALTE